MTRASCVERLWLAMALAQLWCVSLGSQAEVELEEQFQQQEPAASLPPQHLAHKRRKRPLGQRPARRLSCVVRGRLQLLARLFQGETFSVGVLQAEAWPETMRSPQKQKAAAVAKKKTQKEKERRKRQKRRARERSRAAA